MHLTILVNQHKWNHTIVVFSCLTYFTEYNVSKLHWCCGMYQNCILFFFKVENFSIAWIDHILFILSSTDGHLGYFYLLVTVYDAAMSIHLQISVWVFTFNYFGYMPQSEIPGLHGNSMFDFIMLFFMVVVSFYILTSNAPGEGNGTPLQYSCLENPMGGGAWKAAVHGVVKESDMTEQLHFLFSPSCIGEGNGNPLQCSCLENPRDGGAWWAAIYGVTQSRTRLKRPSSSSSSSSSNAPGLQLLHILINTCFSHTFLCLYGRNSVV